MSVKPLVVEQNVEFDMANPYYFNVPLHDTAQYHNVTGVVIRELISHDWLWPLGTYYQLIHLGPASSVLANSLHYEINLSAITVDKWVPKPGWTNDGHSS